MEPMPEFLSLDFNQILSLVSLALLLAIIVIGSWLFILRLKGRGKVTRALNMSLFLITLPRKIRKEEGEAPKTEKEIIAVMEQLYSSLSNIRESKDVFVYGQPYLAFEIATPQVGEEIAFYVAMPRRYVEAAKIANEGVRLK